MSDFCECNYHLGMGPNLLCPEHGNRKDLHRQTKKLKARIEELEGCLNNIKQAAMPDPYDERDISLSWLRTVIDKNTPKGK